MFTRVLLAAALAVATTGGAQAATLSFSFTFTNPASLGGGKVTGIVRGLVDNATRPATSVEVLSHTGGVGIGEYVGAPPLNAFTVMSGAITKADFNSFGVLNSAPAVTTSSLGFATLFGDFIGVLAPELRAGDASVVTFTRVDVTPIPVPAALPLLLGGVGAIAFAGRRRARRSAAPA